MMVVDVVGNTLSPKNGSRLVHLKKGTGKGKYKPSRFFKGFQPLVLAAATQIFLEFSPRMFREIRSNLTCAYFSDGWVQPPPSSFFGGIFRGIYS